MIAGENWTEQTTFEGNASAVVIVTGIQECAATRFEFRLECIGLDAYSGPMDIAVYFWDERDAKEARLFFRSTFEIGSCWRISGKIEYDTDAVHFLDPVYMPYSGKACEQLVYRMNNQKK